MSEKEKFVSGGNVITSQKRLEAKFDAFVELFCLSVGLEQEDTDQMWKIYEDRLGDILSESDSDD